MDARILIQVAATATLVLGGCERQSKLYCGMHPTDLVNCGYLDAGIDARPTCTTDPDCAASPGAPYCQPDVGFCVECYLPEHCASNPDRMYCDLDMFRCSSCIGHEDCASNACLPDGTCGDDSTVAYVDPTAPPTNTTCTLAEKCSSIAAALQTKRPYILLQGAIVEDVPVINATSVTIMAEPGTTLTRITAGTVLSFAGGSEVAVYDLHVIGKDDKGFAADKSTLRLFGVTVSDCNRKDRRAIEAKNATLIVSRSTIVGNTGGGIFTDGNSTFVLTHNFIVRNGADDSAVGGVSLGAMTTGLNRFEMNTVVDNRASLTANAGGLHCAANLRAPNNIIARNYANGLPGLVNSNRPGVGGCNLDDSLVATNVTDLAFVMAEGDGPWDYHIGPGSMAIDRGVTSDLAVDFDGDARPYNGKFDFGADEYAP